MGNNSSVIAEDDPLSPRESNPNEHTRSDELAEENAVYPRLDPVTRNRSTGNLNDRIHYP